MNTPYGLDVASRTRGEARIPLPKNHAAGPRMLGDFAHTLNQLDRKNTPALAI
jgi:hypothetical protein